MNGAKVAVAMDYAAWLAEMEELSRTKFVKALEEAGFAGKPNPRRDDATVPEEVARMLDEMTFLPQFLAVRRLHELIRTDGESFERLCALSRGYANLGLLTEFHWHPAHKVFKARALLYAQRMAAAEPKNCLAIWHRAYALAAAGCHRLALRDLLLAEQMQGEKSDGNEVKQPQWVDLIVGLCLFDIERLDAKKVDGRLSQLARLLRYLSLEMSDDRAATLTAGAEAVEAMPECYRIHDGICGHGGVSVQHNSTNQWIDIAGQTLYGRLTDAGLPESAAAAAKEGLAFRTEGDIPWPKEFPVRGKLIAALRAARDDGGEPSWAALAKLIEELSFAQVRRRAEFEAKALAVSADDFLALAAPLTADHPYRAYLDTLAQGADKRAAAWASLRLDADGLEPHESRMCYDYYSIRDEKPEDSPFWTQADHVARDETLRLQMAPRRKEVAMSLLFISPYSPLGKAALVEISDDVFRKMRQQWTADAAKHPRLARAFAAQCAKSKQYAEAEKWLKTAIDLSPDYMSTYELAQLYRKQGKMDKWQETLEYFLDKPDSGLLHATVCAHVARWHMLNKRWAKAEPFAEAAASSYSAWGLCVLADCKEGMRKWKEAEEIHRAIVERYPDGDFNWYWFCKRTGHGKLNAARESVEKLIEPIKAKPAEQQFWNSCCCYYFLAEGDLDRAQPAFQLLYDKFGNPLHGLHIALIADEKQDVKKRDAMLKDILQRGIMFRPPNRKLPLWGIVRLSDLISKDLARGGKAEIDLAKADDIALSTNLDEPESIDRDCRATMFRYFLAKYLSLHGKPDKAVEFWKKCMIDTECLSHLYRSLAGAELLGRGITPESYLDDKSNEPHG